MRTLKFRPSWGILFVLVAAGLMLTLASRDGVAEKTKDADGAKRLRHVVLFKFKDGTSDEQVRKIVKGFAALPGKIDAIADFEYGTDVSVEGKAEGLTHGFVVTFRDEKGRAEYLPHAAHQEFVKLVGPSVDKVLVFDYWAQR